MAMARPQGEPSGPIEGHTLSVTQPEAVPSAPSVHPPAAPPSQPPVPQVDPITILTQQVLELTAAVRGMQEQYSTTAPSPSVSLPPPAGAEVPYAGYSHNIPTHPYEVHHPVLPNLHHQDSYSKKPYKRRRSLSPDPVDPPRRRTGKEPIGKTSQRRPDSSSSSDSFEGDFYAKRTSRRTEQRLDEHHRRLEELAVVYLILRETVMMIALLYLGEFWRSQFPLVFVFLR